MNSGELGAYGATIDVTPNDDFLTTAAMLDGLGYGTIWLSGSGIERLDQVLSVLRATERARVATAIIAADRFDADAVADLSRQAETEYPGRLVLGLGGAHGPKPLATLGAYLDRLDEAVPDRFRVLAALGPRMLRLAGERAGGALPVLVTPEYTASAREVLGHGILAVDQMVVLEEDPVRARAIAAGPLSMLRTIPGYPENFRRMGFTDAEIADLSPRFVDALVAWGSADTVADRIGEYRQAGADHVAVLLLGEPDRREGWETLARTLRERAAA